MDDELQELHATERLKRLVTSLASLLLGALIVGAIVIGYLVLELKSTQHQLARDEHQTCMIQARGLPAGHELAVAMSELSLILKPNPQFDKIPLQYRKELNGLHYHAGRYSAIEAMQPPSRRC